MSKDRSTFRITMFDLKDKVVFITGGATGIGSHVVRILLQEGVKHVSILDINEAAGNALQNELNSKYGSNKVRFFDGDVTNDEHLFGVYDTIIKTYSTIDVVINNAAILNDSSPAFKKEVEVNVTALVSSSLKALDLMRKDQGGKGGNIVNISSIAAMLQTPTCPIYSATKSAVLMFSNCIGLEEYYIKTEVKVITVAFGRTDTPMMFADNVKCFDKDIEAMIPDILRGFQTQRPEHAAAGAVEACKKGESGSTWLVANGAPAKDVTATVKKAYDLLATLVL